MPWLALTLEVEAAGAEALSEALLEAGAHSVCLEDLDAPCCRLSALIGVGDDPEAVVARAAGLAQLAEPPAFSLARVEDEEWVRLSEAQFAPIAIGERLWIAPSWQEPPADCLKTVRAVVRLDPGLAFGTGSHPSTRLVLRFLEQNIQGGERVLDYGCGSGILAIAAAKLGASHADAVDIDPQAIETAAANAAANAVAVRVAAPEDLAPALYDMVVSNILAQPLILLAPLLAGRTRHGGCVALSGILETQVAEVAAAYLPFFEPQIAQAEDGWALVVGRRR